MSDDWSQFATAPPAGTQGTHDWSGFPVATGEGGTRTLASEFGYIDDPARGGSGDPGTSGNWYTGAWGDDIANQRDLGVAIPPITLRQHFGDENLAHGARVAVTNPVSGKTAIGRILDKGPGEKARLRGVGIDLMYAMAREIEAGNNTPVSYRILAAGQQSQDWSAFPTSPPQQAQQQVPPQQPPQSQQLDRNLVDDGTETGRNARAVTAPATQPQDWSAFPTTPPEVPRGTQEIPGAKQGPYVTSLSPDKESAFQSWVKQNKIPWQDAPTSDYDMRGFWLAQQAGDPNAQRAANLHFPDTYKTPYHKTFSNESKYATQDAPHWQGNVLISKDGKVVADESQPQPKASPEATQWEPETQTPQDTPFDAVHKTVQNFWENAKQSAAQLNLGAYQSEAYGPPLPSDAFEKQIKETQASTLLTDQQKTDTIADLRNEQQRAQSRRLGNIVSEKYNIAQAEAAKPDQAFQQSVLGRVSGFAGGAAPYLASGAAGPLAPILAATQMSAGAYASEIDRSNEKIKRLHPDWSDAKVLTESAAAATESAKAAGGAGLLLSSIPIPVVGPLIARMTEKWGLSAASMVLAQQYARLQENAALKKKIDPEQDLYEGLRENLGQDIVQGLAFGFPHAFGEIGRGGQRGQVQEEPPRPQETAVTPPQPVPGPERGGEQNAQPRAAAIVEDNGQSSEPVPVSQTEPPLVSGHTQIPAARYNGKIYTGTYHGDISAPDGAEYGYWDTNLRKFIGPKEEQVPAPQVLPVPKSESSGAEGRVSAPTNAPPSLEASQEPAEFYAGLPWPKISLETRQGIGGTISSLVQNVYQRVKNSPHGEDLSNAYDEYWNIRGELEGKEAVLNRRFKELTRQNPNLDEEVHQIGRYAEENGQLPPQISPQAQEWLQIANNGLVRELGDMMRANQFVVRKSDGATRPFIGAPPGVTPFQRIMRPDVSRILENPLLDKAGNLTPEAQQLYQEGQATIDKNSGKPFFEKPQDLLDWARTYKLRERQGPGETNLEKAREVRYPSFFYTYSPQATLGSLRSQIPEIARLVAFGQKIKGPDLFDKTEAKLNGDLTLTKQAHVNAVNAFRDMQRDVYQTNKSGPINRYLGGATSIGMAGRPSTSGKILLSSLFNPGAYRGWGRTVGQIVMHTLGRGTSMDELRRLDLSSDIMTNLSDDPRAVTSAQQKAQNFFTGSMRVAGHTMAQDISRSITAAVSRSWVMDSIRAFQKDPNLKNPFNRARVNDIRSRGLDPAIFRQGGSIDPRTIDRLIREDVLRLQTSYRQSMYPGWASTQVGRFIFRFGHWAYDASERFVRDAAAPFAKAIRQGDMPLAGVYALRIGSVAAAQVVSEEVVREFQQLFGRQSNVASIGEIWKAFSNSNPVAAHLLLSRLGSDFVGGPVFGMFGDAAQWIGGLAKGTADTTHAFNPASPASVAYLKIMWDAVNQMAQQHGKLSEQQIRRFVSNLNGLVSDWISLANTAGVQVPKTPISASHAEDTGRRNAEFVRSRLHVFHQDNPAFPEPIPGKYAGNVHTPYLQNLNDALISGNATEARQVMHKMQTALKLDDKTLKSSVESSVRSHEPIPTGKLGAAFTLWARRTLTPDETQRMRAIQGVYLRTAVRAGIAIGAASQR